MNNKKYRYMVCTRCTTYNHAPYIVDAMNGFTCQETTFPVVYVIVDDASTDGEARVIREYLEENFTEQSVRDEEYANIISARHNRNINCFFVALLLKYNHGSIKKSKNGYLKEWYDEAKYNALCEGDDYWTSPNKLQKQVEFLESHDDYSLVCNKTILFSQKNNCFSLANQSYESSKEMLIEDVILRGGGFISTCSVMYKSSVRDSYPDYCLSCHVGDYPLQLMCAMKGKLYYMNDAMSVYRVDIPNSWTNRSLALDVTKKWKGVFSENSMLIGFLKDYPQYAGLFKKKISSNIIRNMPGSRADFKAFIMFFNEQWFYISENKIFRKIWLKYSFARLAQRIYMIFHGNQQKPIYKENK